MSNLKPLSRRKFLKGTGGVAIGLPFLEAMLPRLAWAAAPTTPRFVMMYGGVPTYFKPLPAYGALVDNFSKSCTSLNSVKQHVSMISGLTIPIYAPGTTPPPGSGFRAQHYVVPAPMLAGMTSYDGKPMNFQSTTVDQLFADRFGTQNQFKSIQVRTQAAGYLYKYTGGIISSRYTGGVLSSLEPIVSPLELFSKLFSGVTTSPPQVVAAQLLDRKSVLDLVLGDISRITGLVSGADRAKLEQHFEEIRNIERRISSSLPPPPSGGSCTVPTNPGADPTVVNPTALGGWGNETLRGDIQADIIALALSCDLTRSVSWQLTYDQCGMGSQNITGVQNDLHQISHDINNNTALGAAMEEHLNWHCARFAKLVDKLSKIPEGTGSVLDNTFIGMGFGEGANAHDRSNMTMFVAGRKDDLKLGQHIKGNGEHPVKIFTSGLNSLGMNVTSTGQIAGNFAGLMK